eukprot:CAMPEP_0194331164 /NCGR_PEP_ID=MMETSP0171-20130528/54545_1 /TAXON_ID=218684 /ORGANISM="Corethron pennatum, Strain L29A3" /LENGTH=41 /DNA_ID= /DNA_START= /DNA_END= /DNA_ORIENTATION=
MSFMAISESTACAESAELSELIEYASYLGDNSLDMHGSLPS